MIRSRLLLILSMFFILFGSFSQPGSRGNLVIVGGGLEAGNKSVYQQLIGFAGGPGKATFAVIPSSSGTPMQSYMYFRNVLISYGVKAENIHLANVAMVDDDSTVDINESEWKNNGNDLPLADLVRKCSAVWFTGGDQARTMKTLIRPDGSQTPVLKAVWDVYRSGGVIGGSSAGAAIMSGVMIGGGTSIAALTHGIIKDYPGDDFPEDTGVLITRGLGFFPCGIVDQHFIVRARFGRLSLAVMTSKEQGNLGFGVDENTALVYHGKENRITVAGASGVTLLNASGARISYIQNLPVIENLSVSYLEEGDSWDAATGIITPAEGKQPTKGKERRNTPHSVQDGILSPNQPTFRDLITLDLADNKATDSVQNITMISPSSGFQVTLRKSPSSEGYYTNKPDHEDHYTVINILMDILPVHISVTPMNNKN
jgi:cyanophycinase